MGRKKKQTVTKEAFSILHELMVRKCFADDLENVVNLPDYVLYGYGKALMDEEIRNQSMRGKIFSAGSGEFDGRIFRNSVRNDYPGKEKEMEVSGKLLNIVLSFLGYSDIAEMEESYFKEREITKDSYKRPYPLKFREVVNRKRSTYSKIANKLDILENTKWYFYSYSHRNTEPNAPQIIRQVFEIKSSFSNGDYEVLLSSNPPFSTFSGKILRQYSNFNVLTCELTSINRAISKRLYLNFHTNFSGGFFIGSYLRHSDVGKIYSGSVIIEKIKEPPNDLDKMPKSFSTNTKKVDRVILEFLKDRHLNLLKIPLSIYSKSDLKSWLQGKRDTQKTDKLNYDLYLSTPLYGMANLSEKYDFAKRMLSQYFEKFANNNHVHNGDEFKEMQSSVYALFQNSILDQFQNGKIKDFEKYIEEIKKMIHSLRELNIGFQNIWYPPLQEDFDIDRAIDPGLLIKENMAAFKASKSYLLIYPFPVISGALIEAGMALIENIASGTKPFFILYRSKKDLPLLLRKVDTLNKGNNIIMESLDEIGGISGIPKWFADSKFEKLLNSTI